MDRDREPKRLHSAKDLERRLSDAGESQAYRTVRDAAEASECPPPEELEALRLAALPRDRAQRVRHHALFCSECSAELVRRGVLLDALRDGGLAKRRWGVRAVRRWSLVAAAAVALLALPFWLGRDSHVVRDVAAHRIHGDPTRGSGVDGFEISLVVRERGALALFLVAPQTVDRLFPLAEVSAEARLVGPGRVTVPGGGEMYPLSILGDASLSSHVLVAVLEREPSPIDALDRFEQALEGSRPRDDDLSGMATRAGLRPLEVRRVEISVPANENR